jgi:aryl-phospho-beta-D-glucosidase BglC (GH1 family)
MDGADGDGGAARISESIDSAPAAPDSATAQKTTQKSGAETLQSQSLDTNAENNNVTERSLTMDEQSVFKYDFTGKKTALPEATAQKLPQWKGFNLLNLFNTLTYKPFDENIFRMISDFGFNFVRLPIDYRCMIKNRDWNEFNEKALQQIDRALEFGIKYDVHICINLHRAPGYTVATPPEPTDLWRDSETQKVFNRMWSAFAARYKEVPNEYMSFNLVNEPPDMDERTYAKVMGGAADAIWAQDPDRLIIADGIAYGVKPSYMIKELGIAQATRGYQPFNLTHYKAEWVNGADKYPTPAWPDFMIPMYLYGYSKRDIRSIYEIEHNFVEAYNLDINIGIVSDNARLVVKADDATVFNRNFVSEAGDGEWKTAVYASEWKIYQNIYDRDYRVEIPANTSRLTIEVTSGDWMSINKLTFAPESGGGREFTVAPNNADWGAKIPPLIIGADGVLNTDNEYLQGRKWLRDAYLKPWEELMESGCGVMVGEWGAYNKTPHDVVMRWMEDSLINYKEAGIGWALWNFDDAFGIMNSNRVGATYENFEGRKLDREMLELLQKY